MHATKRRGSSLILVLILMVSMTAILIAGAAYGMSAERRFQRKYTDAKASAAFLVATEFVESFADSGLLNGGSWTASTAAGNITVVDTDNDATNPRTFKIASTFSVDGRSYKFEQLVAGRQPAHPIYYALFADNELRDGVAGSVQTTSADNAAIHAHGRVKLDGYARVEGDVSCATNTVQNNVQSTMRILSNSPSVYTIGGATFDTYVTTSIPAVADDTTTNQSRVNYTFGSVTGTNPFWTLYVNNSNFNLSGTLTGVGTIVIDGDCQVTGDLTYANGASRAVIVVRGNLTVRSAVRNLVGLFYVKGDISIAGDASTLNVLNGNLIAHHDVNFNERPIIVTPNRDLWRDRSLAQRHRVPGFWPTSNPAGLMR